MKQQKYSNNLKAKLSPQKLAERKTTGGHSPSLVTLMAA